LVECYVFGKSLIRKLRGGEATAIQRLGHATSLGDGLTFGFYKFPMKGDCS